MMVGLLAAGIGCGRRGDGAAQGEKNGPATGIASLPGSAITLPGGAYPSASISASPSPCIIAQGSGTCSTTITWTSNYPTAAHQIWVSLDGQSPSLMACGGTSGTANPNWIQAGHEYRFSVHPSSSCATTARGAEAASVRVKGDPARLVASPNPCSINASGVCTTTLSWASGYTASAHQVWVSQDGQSPSLVACGGTSGTVNANGIQAGHTYQFTLYTASSCSGSTRATQVASQSVRGYAGVVQANGTGLMLGGAPFRSTGVNTYNLFFQFLGTASGAPASVTRPMALAALDDAAARGVRFIRFNAGPFYGNDVYLWLNNKNGYWAAFDDMVAQASARGIRLVPTIWWTTWAFSDFVGEPLGNVFQNVSISRHYLFQFAQELVTRYAGNPTILFWELTNEMNLGADLDLGTRCNVPGPNGALPCNLKPRSSADNYTSDMMAQLLRDLAAAVKGWDPAHLISSGFATPRASAMHLRTRPEWVSGGDWASDTPSEMYSWIALTHPDPIDVVSVHVYNGEPEQRAFGLQGNYNPDILAYLVTASDGIQKPLYLGEFGDLVQLYATDPSGDFTRRMLLKVLDLRIPAASIWSWEFYPYSPTTQDETSLKPGTSPQIDALIGFYQMVNGWQAAAPANRSTDLPVPNPDFEADANANGLPDGWETVWRNGSSSGYYARRYTSTTAGEVFQNSAVMRLYNGLGDASSYVFAISDKITVQGGKTLVLSYAFRHNLAVGALAGARLIQYDASGNNIGETPKIYGPGGGSKYVVDAFQVKLSSAASKVQIRLELGGAQNQYLDVDDVRLSQLD